MPAARKKGTFPVFSSVTCFSAVLSTFSASAPAVVDAGAEPGAGAGAEPGVRRFREEGRAEGRRALAAGGGRGRALLAKRACGSRHWFSICSRSMRRSDARFSRSGRSWHVKSRCIIWRAVSRSDGEHSPATARE